MTIFVPINAAKYTVNSSYHQLEHFLYGHPLIPHTHTESQSKRFFSFRLLTAKKTGDFGRFFI